MANAQYGVSLSAGAISIQKPVSRSGDGMIGVDPAVVAGKPGTLSTRTDNDTGILTVSNGHGIVDTDTVDVYWAGGRRYNVDVTAVTATTISIDLGSGDNLPVATTAIVVCKQNQVNCLIDGDLLKIIGIILETVDQASTAKGGVTLKDSGGSTIARVDLTANIPLIWDIVGGSANPFTGNIILTAHVTNGSGTEDMTLKIAGVQDATP